MPYPTCQDVYRCDARYRHTIRLPNPVRSRTTLPYGNLNK